MSIPLPQLLGPSDLGIYQNLGVFIGVQGPAAKITDRRSLDCDYWVFVRTQIKARGKLTPNSQLYSEAWVIGQVNRALLLGHAILQLFFSNLATVVCNSYEVYSFHLHVIYKATYLIDIEKVEGLWLDRFIIIYQDYFGLVIENNTVHHR